MDIFVIEQNGGGSSFCTGILDSVGKMPDGLEVPDKAEIVPIEPGLAAVKAYVQPGDVMVVPVAVVRNLVASAALEFGELGRYTTLVIAASPHRLNITSVRAGSTTDSIINLAANS